MTKISYKAMQSAICDQWWLVNGYEEGNPTPIYTVVFSGDNFEARAKEYSTWKNVFAGGSARGINAGKFRTETLCQPLQS